MREARDWQLFTDLSLSHLSVKQIKKTLDKWDNFLN